MRAKLFTDIFCKRLLIFFDFFYLVRNPSRRVAPREVTRVVRICWMFTEIKEIISIKQTLTVRCSKY